MLLVWLMVQERSSPAVVVNDRGGFCQQQGLKADCRDFDHRVDQSLNVGQNCLID
jgi:hypothetical protein